MTDKQKETKIRSTIDVIVDAITAHEKKTNVSFKDEEVLAALVTLMYNIVSISHGGDILKIKKAFEQLTSDINVHANRQSLKIITEKESKLIH